MIFFCKSALETVKKFGWPPHVIHCHGWMTSLIPLYLKTVYKKEPVFSYSKVIYTAQEDLFPGKLADSFVQKAMISGEIKEKDMDIFKEGTATALTLGGAKCADVVIEGSPELPERVKEEIKPSRTKKVVKWDESWKEDVTPLLELYKSLTAS
jgi:starch synthase